MIDRYNTGTLVFLTTHLNTDTPVFLTFYKNPDILNLFDIDLNDHNSKVLFIESEITKNFSDSDNIDLDEFELVISSGKVEPEQYPPINPDSIKFKNYIDNLTLRYDFPDTLNSLISSILDWNKCSYKEYTKYLNSLFQINEFEAICQSIYMYLNNVFLGFYPQKTYLCKDFTGKISD